MKLYYKERAIAIQKPEGKTPEQLEAAIDALKDKYSIREELDALVAKEVELLAMETEIDWYEIKLTDIPGLGDDDSTASGVLPLAVLSLLMEVGIISEEKPRALKSVE
jgi:hypothetical protein